MAAPSKYGVGEYGYDLYSFHISADAVVGPIIWVDPKTQRIQHISSSDIIGPISFSGTIWCVRPVAGVAALPVVVWSAVAQCVRLLSATIADFSLNWSAQLSGEYLLASSFVVSDGSVEMTGDLEVEQFWQQIADPSDPSWTDVSINDPVWTPIETPAPWN